jgi:signal transduction histidine kinase
MGEQRYQQTPASAGRLVALSLDLMGALDLEGRLVWANPAWQAVLGRDPAGLAVTPYLELLHPDDHGRALAGQQWRFTIEDNGIGIDARHADWVFGMFQRLHTRDEFEGTGIGLAIARKVVERHGGEISAAPREGGGTCFAFTLPARADGQ